MRWKTSVAFWKIVPWGEWTSELNVSSVPPPWGHYFHFHSRRISKFGFSFILSTGSPLFNFDFYSGFQNKFSNVISLWFRFPYDKTLFAKWYTNSSLNIFLTGSPAETIIMAGRPSGTDPSIWVAVVLQDPLAVRTVYCFPRSFLRIDLST